MLLLIAECQGKATIRFILSIHGTMRATLKKAKAPFGTVGFSVKNTIGDFAYIYVRQN